MAQPGSQPVDPQWIALFPPQASAAAVQVDRLFFLELAVTGLVLLVLLGLIVYFVIRYQHRNRVDRSARPRGHTARRAEILWSLAPLVIFLGLFGWGAALYLDLRRPPADALEIQGIGKQWMWKFQHPDGQREINELHVPLGRPVRLILTSQDVIHSFYIPAFRIKQDLLPGRYTQTWFTATHSGRFHLFCAEYCGSQHAQMRGRVVVLEPARYQAWLEQRQSGESPAVRGERLYHRYGCAACHAPEAGVQAPDLRGIYGRRIELRDGRSRLADETYLRESILLPEQDVVAGYPPIMPSFQGQLDEDQLLALIAYLKRLPPPEAPPS